MQRILLNCRMLLHCFPENLLLYYLLYYRKLPLSP